ncbi:MAG: hypothetical protein ACK5MN_04590 [Lachnospiraceae bacterium]
MKILAIFLQLLGILILVGSMLMPLNRTLYFLTGIIVSVIALVINIIVEGRRERNQS